MRVKGRRAGVVGVVCVLALNASPAAAETVVTAVGEDATWTAAEGPYVLDGEVVVASGATLTIEPGTRVEGRPGSSLAVEGVLLASGLPSQRITFTSVTARRDWHGITFVGTGTLDTVDGRSAIASADISFASAGVTTTYDSPQLSDVGFRFNTSALTVTMPAGDMAIDDSRFLQNRRAISGRTTSTVTVTGSDFWANRRNLVAGPKRPYDCIADDGAWILTGNDLLRGPRQGWHSGDVAAAPGSANSTFVIDARQNFWGTTDAQDLAGRIRTQGEPYWGGSNVNSTRRPVLVDPASVVATTPWAPPGAGSPAQEPDAHGDPSTWSRIARPQQGACYGAGELAAIRGSAGEALGTLEHVRAAVKRRTADGCEWLVDREATFEPGGCASPVWLRVDGLNDWRLPLDSPLPAGQYVALSRTDDTRGNGLGVERVQFTIND